MRKLVVLDLSSANIDLFESYERKVIPLLSKYKGNLELSVRSVDGTTETHVLYFPDNLRFEGFLSDPSRVALEIDWARSGAVSAISDVEQVSY